MNHKLWGTLTMVQDAPIHEILTEIRSLPQLKNKAGPTKKRKLDYAKILTSILEKRKILDLATSKTIGQRIKEKVKKAVPKNKKTVEETSDDSELEPVESDSDLDFEEEVQEEEPIPDKELEQRFLTWGAEINVRGCWEILNTWR